MCPLIIDRLDCSVVNLLVALLWSGRGITGESLRNLNSHRTYCHLIDSHRHRSVHTRVVHGSGAAWQRLIDVIGFNGVAVWPATYGVPVWNGDIMTLRDYETAALWFRGGLNLANRNGQWLVCGLICKDLRKKWFECANLKTLKMHEELSASFVSCEKALSHRCLCLTLTRKYRRMIKSDVDQERSSETTS